MRSLLFVLFCLLLLGLSWTSLNAADQTERASAFGDLRADLADKGFTFELVYTAEWMANMRGGITTHHARKYRGDVSLFMEFDTERAGLWDNGSFFAHVQNQHGDGITEDYIGDFQVLSNIDADDFTQVSEFWYRHEFLEGRLWTKLGKQESNEDFAGTEFGGEFLHSSPGFSPTIPLVTYPDPDWGMVWGVEPADWFSANAGLYQGRPNGGRSVKSTIDNLYGPMVMVEPALHYHAAGRAGHFRVGAWWNGDRFDEFDRSNRNPGTKDDAHGWYVTWDQEIWNEESPGDSAEGDDGIGADGIGAEGIGLFGQYGWAPPDRSEALHYFGGGVAWTGALPGRDNDVAGIGLFQVEFRREADFERGAERSIELFYRIDVCDCFSIKPDLQFITNPGGTSLDDALVAGVRAEFVF